MPPIYMYMVAKYSSRWSLYRTATYLCSMPYGAIRAVVHPSKDRKFDEVSSRCRINHGVLRKVGCQLQNVEPLSSMMTLITAH